MAFRRARLLDGESEMTGSPILSQIHFQYCKATDKHTTCIYDIVSYDMQISYAIDYGTRQTHTHIDFGCRVRRQLISSAYASK